MSNIYIPYITLDFNNLMTITTAPELGIDLHFPAPTRDLVGAIYSEILDCISILRLGPESIIVSIGLIQLGTFI